jgi:hypothetical protein
LVYQLNWFLVVWWALLVTHRLNAQMPLNLTLFFKIFLHDDYLFYFSVFSSKTKLIKSFFCFICAKKPCSQIYLEVPQPNRNIAHLQEKQCLNKGLNELSHGLPCIIMQTQVSFKVSLLIDNRRDL